jgi:hypothetical protein
MPYLKRRASFWGRPQKVIYMKKVQSVIKFNFGSRQCSNVIKSTGRFNLPPTPSINVLKYPFLPVENPVLL